MVSGCKHTSNGSGRAASIRHKMDSYADHGQEYDYQPCPIAEGQLSLEENVKHKIIFCNDAAVAPKQSAPSEATYASPFVQEQLRLPYFNKSSCSEMI